MKKLFTTLAILSTIFIANAQQTISQGGSGWSTSVKGDLLVGTSSTLRYTRLPIGATGYVLQSVSGQPAWVATSSLGIIGGGGISGSGSNGQVTFWNGASSVTGTSTFFWDNLVGRLLVGTAASTTTYPYALSVFANNTSSDVEGHNIGVVGTALASSTNTNIWGVGGYFKGWTNGATRSGGAIGEGMVTASADTGSAIGVRSYAVQTHVGGANVGLQCQALNGSTNYCLNMVAGDILSNATQNWVFSGSSTSYLNIGGILAIDTTNNRSVHNALKITGGLFDSTNASGTVGQVLTSTGTSTIWSTLSATLTGGQTGFIPRWLSSTTLGTSTILDNGTVSGVNATSSAYAFNIQSSTSSNLSPLSIASSTGQVMFNFAANGRLGIGTTTNSGYSATQPASLFIDNTGKTSQEGINVLTNVNDFFESNIINTSSGANAQACQTVTNNIGSLTSSFGSLCINSSTFSNPQVYNVGEANDVSLMALTGGNLIINNASTTGRIDFMAGGVSTSTNIWASISANGKLGVGTIQPAAQFQVNYGNGTVASTTALGNGGLVEFGNNFNTPYISSGEYQNFLLQTEDFSNASWFKQGVGTVTANNVLNPQNLLVAESIPAGSTATSGVFQTTGQASGGIFTFSVWLRSNTGNATTSLSIDIINGTATTTGTTTILNLTPVWQRYAISTDTGVAARTLLKANIYNGTSRIAAWGAQLEATTTRAYSGAQTTASTSALTRANRFRGSVISDGLLTIAGALSGVTTLSMGGALSGVTTAALSSTLTQTMTALATSTNSSVIRGYYMLNSTAATITQNQQAPIIDIEGKVWSGSASVPSNWRIQNTFPATSTPNATSSLIFSHSLNNSATTTILSLLSGGMLNVATTTGTLYGLTVATTSLFYGNSFFQGKTAFGTTTAQTFGFTVATTSQFLNGIVTNVTGYAAASTITLNIDTITNGGLATTTINQATTFANPTGTFRDGDIFELRVLATTTQTVSWGTVFASSTDLNNVASVASGTTRFIFEYDINRLKLDLVGKLGVFN